MAYSLPTQPLQRRGPYFPDRFFLGVSERLANVPAGKTISLSPSGGGLYNQNQGKLWCSILAVLQIVYAPARFWERGARYFVGRFSFGRRMVPEARAFFWQKDDLGISFSRERYKRFVHITVDRRFSAARLFQITCQSSTTRGYESCGGKLMSGNTME